VVFEDVVEGRVECPELEPFHALSGQLHSKASDLLILFHDLIPQNTLGTILDDF